MDYFDSVIAAKLFGKGDGTTPSDSKLDKVVTTALKPRVYGITTDGGQTEYFATPSADANTVVMRDESKHIAIEDGIAPKQAVNKSQLDKKLDIAGGDITGDLSIAGNVNITGVATHTAEAIFSNGLESEAPVNVNHSFVKITNTDNDIVTQYSANSISLEENGDTVVYNYAFPRASGTFAITQHSTIKNEDTASDNVDAWSTTDTTSSIAIHHTTTDGKSEVLVQNGYAGITNTSTTHSSRVSVGDGVVLLTAQGTTAGAGQTSLSITEDGIKVNDKDIALKDDTPTAVIITSPEGATSGTVTNAEIAILRKNLSNYIVFSHKEYHLNADGLVEGYLTYTYNGYENNKPIQECITVTLSTGSWVLNRKELVTSTDYATSTKAGLVTVDDDFSKGIEVSDTGKLSIYRALDADIAGRTTTRPITPLNLNSAVLASLTDANKITPTNEQKTAFKNTWGITSASGTKMVFASDAPAVEDYSEGDVFVNTSDECFYCLKDGVWTKQDSFGSPSWHTTPPTDTTKVLRTEISWDKAIQYKSGSADTIDCSFVSAGDGYARFETGASGDKLLIGCTNWSITGSSDSADSEGATCIVMGVMYYDVDHNIAKYIVHKYANGATVVGTFFIPTDAKFRYLY